MMTMTTTQHALARTYLIIVAMLAKQFRITLGQSVPKFVGNVVFTLKNDFGIDVSSRVADHVCWRTETLEEYAKLVDSMKASTDCFTLLIESEIGGRPIATFELAEPITCSSSSSHAISVLEIPSPKPGSPYKSGLEHVEFVIGDNAQALSPLNDHLHQEAFDSFLREHADVHWSLKAKDKKINPDISLKMNLEEFGACSVKFHLMPLADVIEFEKKHQR